MGEVKNHSDLKVWQVSIEFVTEIYRITSKFPDVEKFGLSAQLRKASVSIPSNIAEGFGRKNTKELIQFLYISQGSLSEIETQLIIAKNLNYFKDCRELTEKVHYIRRMINGLIKSLSIKNTKSDKNGNL